MESNSSKRGQQIMIEKSPKDQNLYDLFTLENGLQVLLIQDNNQVELQKGGKMASVSLSVNAGSLNDPLHRQGLAHFLEHMIFMGSNKYPDENQYSNHISSHGGYTNAYTELEFTNYYFKVDYKGLFLALDMFMWLLKEPILKKEAQEREIKSIESEFEGNYPYDSSRRYQLHCSHTSDKNHILNRFTWGNLKSLAASNPDGLIDDVRQFFEREYSSERMKLVIQVKTEDNMRELKEQVMQIFSQIPNRNLGIQDFSINSQGKTALPYQDNQNEMIVFNSVKNTNSMQLLFTFKKQDLNLTTQALSIISQLMGHEGRGSLYQNFKQNEFIMSFHSRYDTQQKTLFYTFEVTLTLTEKGLTQYDQVIAGIFRYFKIIRDKISSLKDFDEFDFLRQIRVMSEKCFYYYKIPDPVDQVCELANEMIFIDDHSQLLKTTYSGTIIEKIDLRIILAFLDQMTPANCKITLYGKKILDREIFENRITTTKTEKWFKTKYQLIEKPLDRIQELIQNFDVSNLVLPNSNPLIPEDFSNKATEHLQKNNCPQLVYSDKNLIDLWHQQDQTFQMPRAIVQIIFMSPNFFDETWKRAYWSVFTDTLIETITSEVGYEALMADVSYSIKGFENLGFKIKFQGFNDKLANFIKIFFQIMNRVINEGFKEYFIHTAVEKSTRSFRNINIEVDQKTSNNRMIYLLQHQYHAKQILQELQKFDIKKFNEEFVGKYLLSNIQFVKMLISGNLSKEEAIQISQLPINELKLSPKNSIEGQQLGMTQVRLLKDNDMIIWDSVHDEAAQDKENEDHDSSEQEHENDQDASMEDLTANNQNDDEEQSDNEDPSHSQSKQEDDTEQNKDEEMHKSDDEEEDDEGEKSENNSCIQLYFQSKYHDQFTSLTLQMIESILEELFYDEMRNKQQLGYYVGISRRQTRGVCGLLFVIESAEYDPLDLQERIFAFITETLNTLTQKPALYQEYYEGLVARKKEGFKDIKDEAGYYFGQMKEFSTENKPVQWERLEREIEILETQMSREAVIKTYREILIEAPRVVAFRVFAQKYKELAGNFEIEEKVISGEYLKEPLGETLDMFLNH